MRTFIRPKSATPTPRPRKRPIAIELFEGLMALMLLAIFLPMVKIDWKETLINAALSVSIAVTVVYGPQIVGYFIRPSSAGNTQPPASGD